MTLRFRHYSKPLAGVAVITALAACSSDLTNGNRHPVQLSFTTNTTVVPAGNRLAADVVVGPASELTISKVQFVLSKIELDRAGTTTCIAEVEDANDDNPHPEGGECEDVSRDPLLVDMKLDGTLQQAMIAPLAAGTYRELEARIAPAADRFTDFNTTNSAIKGNSVRVEGSFKGTAFTFMAPVRSHIETEFDPPLVVDETTRNATISLDVSKWFLNSAGQVIDPTTVQPGDAAFQQIVSNIRRSFHAFEDDNERGEDHHEGHNGNDDGSHH
jgi:hypothetical protein